MGVARYAAAAAANHHVGHVGGQDKEPLPTNTHTHTQTRTAYVTGTGGPHYGRVFRLHKRRPISYDPPTGDTDPGHASTER